MENLLIQIESIKPARGTIFGEALLENWKTDSGILVVSEHYKENLWPTRCLVVAVGGPFKVKEGDPGKYYCKPGETVRFKKNAGYKMTINNKAYLFLKNEDICCVE